MPRYEGWFNLLLTSEISFNLFMTSEISFNLFFTALCVTVWIMVMSQVAYSDKASRAGPSIGTRVSAVGDPLMNGPVN